MLRGRVILIGLLAATANAGTLLTGTVDAVWSFPDSGFGISMQGAGVSFHTSDVGHGLSFGSNSWFGGTLYGTDSSNADINGVDSGWFSFGLTEQGTTGHFLGELDIYQPTTSNLIASATIETYLVSTTSTPWSPYYAEEWFTFSDTTQRGRLGGNAAVLAPEPVTWTLMGLALCALCAARRYPRKAPEAISSSSAAMSR